MKTPEKILWPTDFSDLSLKAGRYARGYRDLFGAELRVIHVCHLIIVATHGATGARHILLGSTAERIVHHAPCPVLTLKCHEKDIKDA